MIGSGVRRWRQAAWPLVVSILLLGPALFPGFVLSYDMVWVPDLALRPDFFGAGSGIPRAVPSDAWVAVLDEIVPGMLLQKLVLLGSLVAGGIGIQRWVAGDRTTLAGTAAATLYIWNPYVVERLAIGHWPMLVCYGVLPWLASVVRRSVHEGRLNPGLLLLLPVASLSASAGIAAGVLVAAFAIAARAPRGLLLRFGAVVVVANLPWAVAGALHAGALSAADTGADVFASVGEGSVPGPLTFFTLGGIWNTELVPYSRTTLLVWVSVALVLVAVVLGLMSGRRVLRDRSVLGWWVCGAIGWLLAVLSWAAPGAIDALAGVVPGGGILRDGSRLLLLLAPLLAIAAGAATQVLVDLAGEAAPVVGGFAILMTLAVLPDAAWGIGGDLAAVRYPAAYDAMRTAVAQAPARGDALVLPFTAYRAPSWNDGRKVFDPVGRFQGRDYVASDALSVSGRSLGLEDPRGRAVLRALGHDTPDARSKALGRLGIGVVVVDGDLAANEAQRRFAPEVAGRSRPAGNFSVVSISEVHQSARGMATLTALTLAWTLYVALMLVGVGSAVRRWRTAGHITGTPSAAKAEPAGEGTP